MKFSRFIDAQKVIKEDLMFFKLMVRLALIFSDYVYFSQVFFFLEQQGDVTSEA